MSAALQGKPTSAKGVTFVLNLPGAGTARIVIERAVTGRRASAAATFRRVGVVKVKVKQGRNVIRVKKVKRRKLARGTYRAGITATVAGRALKTVRVPFKIRR